MTTATSPAVPLCASADLADGGLAHVFDLLEYGQPARGFVLRHGGQVVGYLNQCAHVPAEMDWKEGQFLDDSGQWIICSIHGAVYEPATGYCVGGPCRGRRPAAARGRARGTGVLVSFRHLDAGFRRLKIP